MSQFFYENDRVMAYIPYIGYSPCTVIDFDWRFGKVTVSRDGTETTCVVDDWDCQLLGHKVASKKGFSIGDIVIIVSPWTQAYIKCYIVELYSGVDRATCKSVFGTTSYMVRYDDITLATEDDVDYQAPPSPLQDLVKELTKQLAI